MVEYAVLNILVQAGKAYIVTPLPNDVVICTREPFMRLPEDMLTKACIQAPPSVLP